MLKEGCDEDETIPTGSMDGVAGAGCERSGIEYLGACHRDKDTPDECMYCRRTAVLPGCEDRQRAYAMPQGSRSGPVTRVQRPAGEGNECGNEKTGQDGNNEGSL